MFAIVEASGRQFKVEPGRFIDIDMTGAEEGATHTFEKVLMIVDGADANVGKPYVDGAAVSGRVISKIIDQEVTGRKISSVRDKKIIVYKMKPKKGTRVKKGHRTQFTRVMIDSIAVGSKVVAETEK